MDKPVFTYRPMTGIVVAFVSGIFLSCYINMPFPYIGVIALLSLIICVLFFEKEKASSILLLCVFVFLGILHAKSFFVIPPGHIKHLARYCYHKPVLLEGVVASDIETKKYYGFTKSTFLLNAKKLHLPNRISETTGKVMVNVFRKIDLSYGDYLKISGRPHYPFNFSSGTKFSYRSYLENKGIYLILSVRKDETIEHPRQKSTTSVQFWAFYFRNKCKNIFDKYLSKNGSALVKAIILGDRSGIPGFIKELFIKTGTLHILAISGLHVGIIAAMFVALTKFLPVGRRWQVATTIMMILFYVLLTGGRPSVIRSAVMCVIVLGSFILEKDIDNLNNISLAAFLILLFNPRALFEVGFQLSFVCVTAIILFYPKITGWLGLHSKNISNPALKIILQQVLVSLSVWLAASGIIVHYFQIITPVTILANLFVIPCLCFIIFLSMGLLFCGFVFSVLCGSFAIVLHFTLNLMVGGVFLLAKAPFAYIRTGQVNDILIGVYYCILFIILFMPELTIMVKNSLKGKTMKRVDLCSLKD